MLQKIVLVLWKGIQQILGIADPEHVWKWIGEEGKPRWSLGFWFDGFNYQAVLEPSQSRPKTIGLFVSGPCPGSVNVGGGVHYLPALLPGHRLAELKEQGMSSSQVERVLKREIRYEMSLADEFENGLWESYRMTVMVKRGRTVLATRVIDGLKLDPNRLMLGGETHVNTCATSQAAALRDEALQSLKGMAHAVIHLH